MGNGPVHGTRSCDAVGPVGAPEGDPAALTLARLDDQICWYDDQASRNNAADKTLKVIGIAAAALVPVIVAASLNPVAGAGLGALAVIAQATQELFQFQRSWVTFGAAREALKHERYLYLAHAGDYASSSQNPAGLLAVRVERIIGQETSSWAESQSKDTGAGKQ
jgi:hypothetical protein